ncbi:hypothetical protein DPMN_142079 [Dreissena polymorpha]|uniref:Uncharacterized protein n=1 Tax=Dreissena polymorpha TaxID=45954 RepID=A0A9D4GDJ5_DREPO|nr:hypothetical protein DPMN_142079 [Dreissena polymorpha]
MSRLLSSPASTDCLFEQRQNRRPTFDKRLGAFPLCCSFAADRKNQIAGNGSAQLQQRRIFKLTLPASASANTHCNPPCSTSLPC